MGLFKRNYDKPGPGVPKNAPRKTGFARFFEVFSRDLGSLFKLNLLHVLCLLPAQVLFFLAFLSMGSWLFLLFSLLGLLASALVGPSKTALSYCITKMLRDDPGFLWQDYKRAFKENFKTSAPFGMLFSLIIAAQLLAAYIYLNSPDVGIVWVAVFLLSVLLFTMAAPYYFLQAAYLELKPFPLIKNSLLLALGYVPRSIAGALISTALLLGQLLVFPYTLPVTLAFGYSLPMLINLMWIWPPVDKTFSIEETLVKRTSDTDFSIDDARDSSEPDDPGE